MKKLLLGILLLMCSYAGATSQVPQQKTSPEQTDSDLLTKTKERIALAHHALFKLPYDKEYVRNVIVAEVKQNRHTVAPHIPKRETGAGAADIDSWIINYPQEVKTYLHYLNSIQRKYTLLKK